MTNPQHAIVIGAGIGGLATAALLAKRGYRVTVLEKNEQPGGKASVFEVDGFRFDMGPSWYLMPDLFEHFFALCGERLEDHLSLVRLDPSYRIFFRDTGTQVDMHGDLSKDAAFFERQEMGAGEKLRAYLAQAATTYETAKRFFIYKNYDSLKDFLSWDAVKFGLKFPAFSSMHRLVSRSFADDHLQKILEYQLVFLGNSPYNAPALYVLMNHIDFNQGVFYPQGGITKIVEALVNVGASKGVQIRCNMPVKRLVAEGDRVTGVECENGEFLKADIIVSNADRAFTERVLLPKDRQTHSEEYWKKRVLAPSAFILYLGVKGRIPQLTHHNLIFSADWKRNFAEIFDAPSWPSDPSMYVCAPSVTDSTVAPPDHENLFVLVPTACQLESSDEVLASYAEKTIATIAQEMHIPDLRERIVYQRLFSGRDFQSRYNSFQGSALGLAHTLWQTAIGRPNNIHPTLKNVFFVGADTNPGIGMPMCLVSAELVLKRLMGDRSAGPLTDVH